MNEAVIVATARTALAKSFRGSFNDTEAPVLGGHVVKAVSSAPASTLPMSRMSSWAPRSSKAPRAITSAG